MLPGLKRHVAREKRGETAFGGYDHNPVTGEGQLWDMENLSPACFPALSPRRGRTLERTLAAPNGLYSHGALCWVDGTQFYYDGTARGEVEDSPKRFAALGPYILIFPDKAYYHTQTEVLGKLEAQWTGPARITHYAYGAEEAGEEVYQGNAISTNGSPFPFEAGEAVTLSGSTQADNNRTPVIREVLEGGKLLVFSNHTFTEAGEETLTLQRTVPDLDFFCENENRLWGCRGNQIYACALGNPFRWNNFEGLATDSYGVTVGSAGAFTGAFSYLGYPIFFKEEAVHKVYGSKPSNFQVMTSAVSGVARGAAGTLAVASEALFYLSRSGMATYTGGIPSSLARPFGGQRFAGGCGGSDGRRYYAALVREGEETGTLFCYDPGLALWWKEDCVDARWFAAQDGVLYVLTGAGELWSLDTGSPAEVEWMAQTGDFTDGGPDRTGLVRLQLRLELEEGSRVSAELQFDSDGVWRPVRTVEGGSKRTVLLPIVPRRCDHYRLRLRGRGGCRVFGITREYYRGSGLG